MSGSSGQHGYVHVEDCNLVDESVEVGHLQVLQQNKSSLASEIFTWNPSGTL